MKRIILVGGGTAGHVEPAIAVGKWLSENNAGLVVEFVGTNSGVEVDLLAKSNLKLNRIIKAPLPRKLGGAALIWPLKFKLAFFQSLLILRGADLVIGFGGYVCPPIYLAARLKRVPILIHEANAKPGWANKLGSRFTEHLTIAFSGARNLGGKWSNATMVGMPIRKEIIEVGARDSNQIAAAKQELFKTLGFDSSRRTILVFGGSLGAASINSAIEESVNEIVGRGFNLIHAVGRSNPLPKMVPGYLPLGYIENMAEMYSACDLVISRSGAVTCAEIETVNRYALLVPLPIGNGEQEANAQDLVDSGKAQLCSNVQFSSVWLLANLNDLMSKSNAVKSRPVHTKFGSADAIIGQMAIDILDKR